jgi:hypothetical protein
VRFVDEPTKVEARFDEKGVPTPRAFTWQGRQLLITDLGRRWEEKGDDGLVRHFLVMVAGGDRFELIQRASTGRWRIVRAWERSPLI